MPDPVDGDFLHVIVREVSVLLHPSLDVQDVHGGEGRSLPADADSSIAPFFAHLLSRLLVHRATAR
ncbi:hypothetical protein CRI94_06730 [Longibacter salinarum]|uniref:Uncharacterized protein n=1 Tax=Longibacter salinarum TaxID=1850348 RepID=A0A2A8CYG5_9BACT|nr:hypothetical protein CRI94_06730 [Longibacter salinarum]